MMRSAKRVSNHVASSLETREARAPPERARMRSSGDEEIILPVLPLRLTFFDESADAFFGVAGHHVLGHYLCRIAIGVRKAHLGLTVERGLAEFDRIGGFQGDLLRQRDSRIPLGAGGNDAVDEADIPRRRRRNRLP